MVIEAQYRTGQIVTAVVICMLTAGLCGPLSWTGGAENIKHVLVLYPQDCLAVPAYRMIYTGMKAVFSDSSESQLNLFDETRLSHFLLRY